MKKPEDILASLDAPKLKDEVRKALDDYRSIGGGSAVAQSSQREFTEARSQIAQQSRYIGGEITKLELSSTPTGGRVMLQVQVDPADLGVDPHQSDAPTLPHFDEVLLNDVPLAKVEVSGGSMVTEANDRPLRLRLVFWLTGDVPANSLASLRQVESVRLLGRLDGFRRLTALFLKGAL